MEIRGIDVSKWQGKIDWGQVAANGVRFAMVRIGTGSNKNTPQLDSAFADNIRGATQAGLDVGAYLYSYAQSTAAAGEEAAFVLKQLEPCKGKIAYPIAYDVEDASQSGLGKGTLTAICDVFLSAMRSAGWRCALYANLDWVKNKLDMTALAKYDLWLAQWASKMTYGGGTVSMWQSSGKGKVSGISGDVDLNTAYLDYPALVRGVGLNGYAPDGGSVPAPNPAPARKPTLRLGSTGPEVEAVQGIVIAKGQYDAVTEQAVKIWQKAHGLTADGIVGEKTWAALMSSELH